MKILHVEGGSNLYGGARQVLYLLEGLQQRGIQNVLICPRGSDLARAAQRFAEVREIPMRGDLDPLLSWRLYRIMRRIHPDLVHLHSRIGADVMGGIAARLAGLPIVHSRRQDNPEAAWWVDVKYRLHHRVVAISEGIRQVLLSEGLAPEKVTCVRSAVDPGPFQHRCDRQWFQREFGLGDRQPVIGVVAQLIGRKGHRFLLRALPGLIGEFPELRVIFFGKGPKEAPLRELIRKLDLADRVHLAGYRVDLPSVVPCLDLLVHPALREGLGISLLQAAGAGVPIVASNAGGMPEAVRDGENGLLVAPGDVGALAGAIGTLLADPDRAARMGQAGRALIAREFSVDNMVQGNLRVYRELLSELGREWRD